MQARQLPRDDAGCGWWRLLPPPLPARRLVGDVSTDCVVIGAGFTGLAVARRLALRRPDWHVALVEAERAGYGASGRNSGFASSISHRDPDLDLEGALRVARLCRAGLEWLGELVEEHRIACDWSDCGRIHAAVEPRAVRNLDRLRRLLDASEETHDAMDRSALATAIGSHHYRSGVHVKGTVLIQPAALTRGLATTLPSNVSFFEESPMEAIGRDARWELRAREGVVRADRVFVALNGFAPALGLLRRRVFPLLTFASLTRALDADEQRQVGAWNTWGLVSEDRMGTTLRRTPDQRILVRGGARYAPSLVIPERAWSRIREQHRRSLRLRWPALEGVDFEFTWGGVMGMTLNQGQFFGRLGHELYASVGYNGTGVALGTASGMLLADHALGDDSELLRDALSLPGPAWLPPEPLLGLGLETRRRLLEATIECLAERGYAGTTTLEVARRARLTRGAQIHHFPTKADLVRSAIAHLDLLRLQEFGRRFKNLRASRDPVGEAVEIQWSIMTSGSSYAQQELIVAARSDPERYAALEPYRSRRPDLRNQAVAEILGLDLEDHPELPVLLNLILNALAGMAASKPFQSREQLQQQLELLKELARRVAASPTNRSSV